MTMTIDQEIDQMIAVRSLILQERKVGVTSTAEAARAAKDFGFQNSPSVKKLILGAVTKEEAERQLELIQLYHKTYPGYRFLTSDQVEKLCLKHKLCIGAPQHFIGEIPVRNMKEIEVFQSCNKTGAHDIQVIAPKTMFEKRIKTTYGRGSVVRVLYEGYRVHYQESMFTRTRAAAVSFIEAVIEALTPEPDPIVLRSVNGGYIVVTMWGPEAELPEVNDNN